VPEESRRWSKVVFSGLFLAALLLFGRIMVPFVIPVLLGAFLVVLFAPLHARIGRLVGERPSLAAALSTLAVVLLILAPLVLIAVFVAREALLAAGVLQEVLEHGDLRELLASKLPAALQRRVAAADGAELERALMTALSGGAAVLKDILGMGTGLALDAFLCAVSIYYFFLDGRRLFEDGVRLLPLDPTYTLAFAKEFKDVSFALVYGSTATAALQALVGYVGLRLVGVAHPEIWAVAMGVVAFIPLGGTALVWGPLGLGLLLAGKVGPGLFLLAWGGLLVSTLDNLVRPRLCGRRMAMHPLLVFLSMFGGLAVFGVTGILFGPLITALFMAMLRIYRRDFLPLGRLAQT
jgi:predicted PurR-regulated permease PerM